MITNQTVDHYAVLGLEREATDDEIKKAHRRLIRRYHPDTAEQATDDTTAKFRQVQEAWGCLSDPIKKAAYDKQFAPSRNERFGWREPSFADSWGGSYFDRASDWAEDDRPPNDYRREQPRVVAPPPEDILVDGVKIHVKYKVTYAQRIACDFYVQFDDAYRLNDIPNGTDKSDEGGPLHVMIGNEEVFEYDNHLYSFFAQSLRERLDAKLGAKQAILRACEYEQRFAECGVKRDALYRAGIPVVKLSQLLHEAGIVIDGLFNRWAKHDSETRVVSLLGAIDNEIKRIEGGGSQLLVDGLLSGQIYHPDVEANKSILVEIARFTIRSGGTYGKGFDEAALYDFYTERVGNRTKVSELDGLNLLIVRDDYVVDDDPDLAPESVELDGRKGPVSYSVVYDYKAVGGQTFATGTLRIARAVYDRLGYEYAKDSGFPELPYGIRLLLEVTLDDKVIASGWDDAELRSRVEKHRKGQQRGKRLSSDEQNLFEATPAPPWLKSHQHRR